MGQYHITVNLDKKQYLMPHKLGDGLKLLEQAGSSGGVSDALLLLLAVSNGRGGGDVHTFHPGPSKDNPYVGGEYTQPEIVGSWGGDRIAVIGDYAEPGDLPPEFRAELIYGMCRDWDDKEDADLDDLRDWWNGTGRYANEDGSASEESNLNRYSMTFDAYVEEARQWRDISDDIKPVLAEHLGFRYLGDGWQKRVEVCYEHPDKVRGHWDHTDSKDPFIVTRPPRMSESELDLNLRMGVPPEMLGVSAAEAKARNNGWAR